jgi:hypothetical protein
VAYHWEQKRPVLRPVHWWSVFVGLGAMDTLAIGLVWWRRQGQAPIAPGGILTITPTLWGPAAAGGVFCVLAFWIKRRSANQRVAGQGLMLAGLLWLIVYDASFVTGYVGGSGRVADFAFLADRLFVGAGDAVVGQGDSSVAEAGV